MTTQSSSRTAAALALAVALGFACACETSKVQPPPQASAQKSAARAQALTKFEGAATSPVDAQLKKAQQLAASLPEKPDSWVALGHAWVRKARDSFDPLYYKFAEASAAAALEIAPNHPRALDVRALVLMNDHRFEEARAIAQQIASAAPEDAMAQAALSDALLELGRYAEAEKAAQQMMDLKPNLPSYSRAAHFFWLRGDPKAALETARLAIDAGSDSRDPEPRAWVIVQAAQIFWNKGDLDGADAGYDRALQDLPEFPAALVGKGQVALAQGRAKDAVGFFERSFRKLPLPGTLWLLGDARSAAGDAKGAEEAWSRVERQGGSDPRTQALFLATKNRSIPRAVELAKAELAVRGDLYTEDASAWALYRAGRFAEARAASDKAIALGTPDPRLLYHAGAIRLAQGESAGRALVEKALALNPRFDETAATEAKELLALPRSVSRR